MSLIPPLPSRRRYRPPSRPELICVEDPRFRDGFGAGEVDARGELSDDGPAVDQHPGSDLLEQRTVRLEIWAGDALARALEADPVIGPHGPSRCR